MRHRVKGKKLGRNTGHRKALRLNLARELLLKGRIKTTRAKADYVRGHVEKIITVAKRGIVKSQELDNDAIKVHAMRVAASRLNNDRDLVKKLFDDIAPRYENRPGGYTRIYKLGPRKGDNAEMVLLELVEGDTEGA
ncbi:MAG: 50S ribosomal protein L17 [Phototrophicales bacterium]|nr:MAG: 50S ribosomal protein L17 [Phototrophicales bacterium]RMG70113.1 MAG: 50S ribosomal protein L17 [Chloroflexota bacterium]